MPVSRDFEAGRAVSRRYRNRRIGDFLKELDLTEGRSTGVPKMLKVMAANGSPVPVFETDDDRLSYLVRLPVHPLVEQATDQVTMDVAMEVADLLTKVRGEMSRPDLQAAMGLKNADHFRRAYLTPAMTAGLLEMTAPDSPRSTKQRYRLTAKGQQWLASQGKKP